MANANKKDSNFSAAGFTPTYGQLVFATPAKGVVFRKEDGTYIKPEGEPVVLNSFWKRRENDGDVAFSLVPVEAEVVPAE